jgi:hypothetical protein
VKLHVAGLLALSSVTLATRPARADQASDHELTVLPVVGGDSDVGIGGGYVASFARLARNVDPYLWRLESAGAIMGRFDQRPAGLGYLDDYLLFDVPHAFGRSLHLSLKTGYTDEPGLVYYGLGNASVIATSSRGYYEFERRNVRARADATYHWASHFILSWRLAFVQNRLLYPADGKLGQDLAGGPPAVRRLLHAAPRQDSVSFSYGLGWDSRDDEVSTQSGQYHTVRVELAPGGSGDIPYSWARVNANLRAYVPLVPERLTFAARVVFDALLGDPPFHELSRAEDDQAVGGGRGVRGVPAGRYYGTVKAFANLELRSELVDFHAFHKRNRFGVTGFFDTGRVFSTLPASPALEGRALGLKVGAGAGLRLTAGESFVLRADLAWSPDAHPVGGYLLAGQLF